MCPEPVVVAPRMAAYSEASRRVFEVFGDTTPLVEGISIDEAFLDVGGLRRVAGEPREIAARLRARVRDEVGLPLSVGIASTKFLAKVASAHCKPDGLLDVPAGGELAFLHPLPVRRIWGVGRVTEEVLHGRGVHTVGELAAVPLPALETWLGSASARHLHALGAQPRPPTRGDRSASCLGRCPASSGPARRVAGRGGGGAARAGRPRDPSPSRRRAPGAHGGDRLARPRHGRATATRTAWRTPRTPPPRCSAPPERCSPTNGPPSSGGASACSASPSPTSRASAPCSSAWTSAVVIRVASTTRWTRCGHGSAPRR